MAGSRVLLADAADVCSIAEAARDSLAPGPEFGARPLEAMVGMTHLARRHALEARVVLDVWRRHDDEARPRELEHDALECRQPIGVDMLDHLDERDGVIAFDAPVAVGQRALQQAHTIALTLRHPVETQPALGDLQGLGRDVDTENLGDPPIVEQPLDELAGTASQIDDAADTLVAQRLGHAVEALVVQSDRLLQRFFGGVLARLDDSLGRIGG